MYNELNQKIMIMQLQAIISSLKAQKTTDPAIIAKINQAEEYWNEGNIQECAQVLNEIIYREGQTEDEKAYYAAMLQEVQTLASNMLSQYLEQYQQLQPGTMQMMMNAYQQQAFQDGKGDVGTGGIPGMGK